MSFPLFWSNPHGFYFSRLSHTISYLPLWSSIYGFFFSLGMEKKTIYAIYTKKSVSFPIIPYIRKKILLNTDHNKNFFMKYITKFTLMINFTYPVNWESCSYLHRGCGGQGFKWPAKDLRWQNLPFRLLG